MPLATTTQVYLDGGVEAIADVYGVSWQAAEYRVNDMHKLEVL